MRLVGDGAQVGVTMGYAGKAYTVMFGTMDGPTGRISIREGERLLVDRPLTQVVQPQRYFAR